MPLPTIYNTGTASVANGATTVTLVGAVSGAIYAGDLFCDPAQPLVPPQRIATDPVAGVFDLAVAWPGTSLTADPYEVRITPDSARVQERTRRLLNEMSVVEANGRGLFYLFATATADADPGAGYLRLNNATIGSATAAYLDNTDANGAAVQTILDTWDDSGASGGRGQLWVRSVAAPSTFHTFNVTGSVVDGTGYRKLTLTYIGGSGTLNADDELMVDFVPVGPAGGAGTNGVDGKFSGTEIIKTAAYTALAADVGKTIILNKATADTLSFDPAATLGSTWMVIVKNIGAGTWSLDPDGAETIDGAATVSLEQNESVVVSCNGTALRSLFRGSAAFTQFTAASSAGPAQLDFAEDTDNGTNKISLKPPASIASDKVATLQDVTGTIALTADIREKLTAARTFYVGASIPTPTITIATPAVVSSTAHGLSTGDAVVFNVPQNTKAATISAANPAVVTMANTFAAGQPVRFASTGSLPYGIVPGTTYYVIATGLSGSSFQISATVGGAAISTAAPTATFTNGSANIGITTANTYYSVGQTIRFATTGGLPTNFAVATDYYIVSASSTLITVSATNGGTAIVAGSAGTGTQTALQSGSHFTSSAGALPTGITEGTVYYVIAAGLTANAFEVSATPGGAAVNTSGSVTGTPIYGAYTGNDANDGLTQTRAGAWLTVAKAVSVISALDLSTFNVTVQLQDGYWNGAVLVSAPWIGSGTVTLQGNTTTPSNVTVNGSTTIKVTGAGARLTIAGLSITSSGSGIVAENGGQITLGAGIVFGACPAGFHMIASGPGAVINGSSTSYSIAGASARHASASPSGYINLFNTAVTMTGSLNYSGAFAYADRLGFINAGAVVFTGSATGVRYSAATNAVINTSGGGANFLPGSSAGTTATGGQYV